MLTNYSVLNCIFPYERDIEITNIMQNDELHILTRILRVYLKKLNSFYPSKAWITLKIKFSLRNQQMSINKKLSDEQIIEFGLQGASKIKINEKHSV